MLAAPPIRPVVVAVALAILFLVAGCGADGNDAGGDTADRAVATFRLSGGEEFKVELTTPELIENAQRLLQGEEAPAIPLGTVVRDSPGVNAPWTWHLDPATVEFADFTTAVCDGQPSDVEQGLITSEQYCPWSATVVAVDPIP